MMKVYTKYLTIKTKKIEFVGITERVSEVVNELGIKEGIVLVNPIHITASVFINDNEQGLLTDFEAWLEKLAPKNFDYKHHLTGENNGYAHLWRTLMGKGVL